ncbi:uncharacterized protein [Anabrus simplex]|uniref:uncharacterized protein n=1 Tax=Anabrus simplex TaxID=316456 RepID=UPI0034DD3282
MSYASPVRLVVSSCNGPTADEPLYVTNIENSQERGKQPLLTRCCCGSASLRSGTLCIGLLSMLDSVTGFLLVTSLYDTVISLLPISKEEIIPDLDQSDIKVIVLIVSGLLDLLQCVLSVALFYGAKEQKGKFLIPWILLYSVSVPVSIVLLVLTAIVFFLYAPAVYGVGILIFCAVTTVLPSYFLIIVFSYYRELELTGPLDPTANKEVFQFPRRYSKEHTHPSALV